MNFDYATVQSSVAALFGTNQDIGKGIADMLVDRLVNDGTYSVIERKELDKILAEQNFSNSDRADPSSAAKIGEFWAWTPSSSAASRSSAATIRDARRRRAARRRHGRFGIGGVKTRSPRRWCRSRRA